MMDYNHAMVDKQFEELITKRSNFIKSVRDNEFDFDHILAGLYSEPSHFIYELLQNAEDEGAKLVEFKLYENRLDIYHNGKDFDLEDIHGITGIGISKKKEDFTTIGKFGVGFKSVFAVTNTPHIYSGDYKIRIKDFVVPEIVNDNERSINTLIRLPFNHTLRNPKEIYAGVAATLENIGLISLLFMKNIEEIRWQKPSLSGCYLRSTVDQPGHIGTKTVTIKSSNVTEEYLVISKPIIIEGKKLKVEVAYKFGIDKDDRKIIVPELNSKLVVYFPTETRTYLKFILQGPYKTTPNRESIPLDDQQNKVILEETAILVADSLPIVKKLGYLDVNFLDLLPINSEFNESSEIYSAVYSKVKETLLSEELLPTTNSKYTKAKDALLARGKELTEFLDKKDTEILFSKRCWLDKNITYDKTRVLREYLIKELEVTEVDFEDFAKGLTASFLQTKSDTWLANLYVRFLDQTSLWNEYGILRNTPIIRLENGEHLAPFGDNGNIQVYLPTKTGSKYKTVKPSLIKNSQAMKFLTDLGLREPDLLAEVKEFILPKYQTDDPIKDSDYFEDFKKILNTYDTIPNNGESDFLKELSKLAFIDSENKLTKEKQLRKPSEVYLTDDDLQQYFEDYPAYYVSDQLYKTFDHKKLTPFLKESGVEDKPRRKQVPGNLSWEDEEKITGDKGFISNEVDYEYEGLEHVLKTLTKPKSVLLWKFLLKSIQGLNPEGASNFFKGNCIWYYRKEHYEEYDAKFLKTIRQALWLYNKNSNLVKSTDITFSELSDDYQKDRPNINVLVEVLQFKPDIVEQLPEEMKEKLNLVGQFSVEEIKEMVSQRVNSNPSLVKQEMPWNPEDDPDKGIFEINDEEPEKIISPDRTNQTGETKVEISELDITDGNSRPDENNDPVTAKNRKLIGDWGEKRVYHYLIEKYKKLGIINETSTGFEVLSQTNEEFEIIWLNKQSDTGKGCDFIIKKDGKEIEYIEVKSKTGDNPELITISGAQWEFSRKLFDTDKGDFYSIYVVQGVGTEAASIKIFKNPIRLWKEGKLYAHPINFKF
jgi:hypothetical protein